MSTRDFIKHPEVRHRRTKSYRALMSLSVESTIAPGHTWLVDMLLREQQELPAVDRFSQWHRQAPDSIPRYRDLIPLTLPGSGEQYAFEVDLNACSGCKACVTACHSLNGLEDEETWRSVGLVHGQSGGQHTLRYVTTACHHCIEPACLQGCPTKAYEKDPVTGIVRHLDDQCFGCQYCVLMCPYEVPKYSVAKGIVRKCDMCRQRLAAEEAPACVQACPNQAIKICLVSTAEVLARTEVNDFLPSAPDARLTRPTTCFLGSAALAPTVQAGDDEVHAPAHPHWPLVFMLVLSQMSVGILTVGHVLTFWLGWLPLEPARFMVNVAAAFVGLIGANLAVFHLGRPLSAYRAWLGWRTSWLSREVLAFGAFVPLLVLTAAASCWPASRHIVPALEIAAIAAGALAVFCSAQIYAATRRPWWSSRRTVTRFVFTTFILGNATCASVAALLTERRGVLFGDYRSLLGLLAAAMIVVGWRLLTEDRFLRSSLVQSDSAIRGTGQLLDDRPLRYAVRKKRAFTFAAAFGLPLFLLTMLLSLPDSDALRVAVSGLCFLSLACALAGELTERYLFFAACVSPRMPGGLA